MGPVKNVLWPVLDPGPEDIVVGTRVDLHKILITTCWHLFRGSEPAAKKLGKNHSSQQQNPESSVHGPLWGTWNDTDVLMELSILFMRSQHSEDVILSSSWAKDYFLKVAKTSYVLLKVSQK
jgi:hypothetical protein